MIVGKREIKTRATPAKYFPKTISKAVSGCVYNNSMVPVLFSSAKSRIVTAGTRNRYNQGAKAKSPLKIKNNSPVALATG